MTSFSAWLADVSRSSTVGGAATELGLFLPAHWALLAVFSFLFGCCIGSFLNVCIYRIPLGQSVVRPRSHCMRCGSAIPWYHNIPVVSYFALRGKCASCGAPFSFRYAAVEAFTGMLFTAAFCTFPAVGAHPPFGLRPLLLPVAATGSWAQLQPLLAIPVEWVFLSGLVLGSLVDFDHLIIPDSVTIGGMVAGIALSALVPQMQTNVGFAVIPGVGLFPVLRHPACALGAVVSSLIGLCAGFALLQTIRVGGTWTMRRLGRIGRDDEAMGFGDVKLLGAIGAFLGWQAAVFSLVAGAFLGLFGAVPALLRRPRPVEGGEGAGEGGEGVKGDGPRRIPFGPFLAMGAAIWLFWGHRLVCSWLLLVPPWRLRLPWL